MTLFLFILLCLSFHPLLLHSHLTPDALLLLKFKLSVLSDPLAVLANWNSSSPCQWKGIRCDADGTRVLSLLLPNSRLVGVLPPDLGRIQSLQTIDLSGNSLNATIPLTLFTAPELRELSLADNDISGELPEFDAGACGLRVLDLSDNALVGDFPARLSSLSNLTELKLANNYISGELPAGGFRQLEFLDLSSNFVNGSLPPDLAGRSIRFLNLSRNRISGEIPPELGRIIPREAVLDFSYNELSGQIPPAGAFPAQKPVAFAGNRELCGKPLKKLCSANKSPPALAAIPNEMNGRKNSAEKVGMRPAVIAAIAVGDLAGIALLFVLFLFVYQSKKKNQERMMKQNRTEREESADSTTIGGLACCLRRKGGDGEDSDESSESTESSESEAEDVVAEKGVKFGGSVRFQNQQAKLQHEAVLVSLDTETTELETETLLKASAYILGATEFSIVYKAVLEDGTTLAVRRIGESSAIDKLKDFDAQVRSIAKFHHPNLLRLRGFYWGPDEKLLIHDYAPNGSLANVYFSKKLSSSPLYLNWEARLRIARGVARGLAYLHDKKGIHGNVRPSNILLDADMEPKIGDFGLDRLMIADGSYKMGTSTRQFGSARSMQSSSSLPDLSPVAGASPCGSSSTTAFGTPYHAPESLKNLKPTAKWDVYSFGMVLLELITGRVFSEVELCQWNTGFVAEEKNRILRMIDPAIRVETEGREETMLSCFKLAISACTLQPQKRPSMKEAVHILEKAYLGSSTS